MTVLCVVLQSSSGDGRLRKKLTLTLFVRHHQERYLSPRIRLLLTLVRGLPEGRPRTQTGSGITENDQAVRHGIDSPFKVRFFGGCYKWPYAISALKNTINLIFILK